MRALIFTDVPGHSTRLIQETLRLAQERGDLEICGIVCSRPQRFSRGRHARKVLRRALVAVCNRDVPFRTVVPPRLDLMGLERTHGIRLLVPQGGDPNADEFVGRLRREVKPQLALSYECSSVFRAPLLGTFEQAVNYHAGLLPHYRGVMATSFSVLAREAESGFTFHRMTERIDHGPILVQGTVAVADGTVEDIGRRKLEAAIAALPQVLDKVVARDPGSEPGAGGCLYRARDWQALIRLNEPEFVTEAQLRQRIRAFGIVHLRIDGIEYPVTRVRSASKADRFAFRTVDGHVLAPDRFNGLPRALSWLDARRSGT